MNGRSGLGERRYGVLSIRPFRRLWIATSLSSLGDWLSLLALTTLAASLTGKHAAIAAIGVAVSGVWITSLLPSLLLGPLAGALADRVDRRKNLIIGDVLRAVLYLSIPLNLALGVVGKLTWIYVAQFLASCASLFWTPAKDASVPNLVPVEKLEQANQLSLFTTYGTAPLAALLFIVLAWISRSLSLISGYFGSATSGQVNLALYFNAATFVISAITVSSLRELPRRRGSDISVPSVAKAIWEGWRFIGQTAVVRGITIGMTGAFAAAGIVVGLGYGYVVSTLHGGAAGWGLVFAAIFVGLALGMSVGLRVLRGFSRRRLFGLAIAAAGVPLALIGLIPNLAVVAVLVLVLGACAGVAYVTGYTIIGSEVDDETRGRTFAFLQSAIRVVMFAVIAASSAVAAGLNETIRAISGSGSATIRIGNVRYDAAGNNVVLLLGAAVAIALGILAYRQMDDRPGVPLLRDLAAALRRQELVPGDVRAAMTGELPTQPLRQPPTQPLPRPRPGRGLLLAIEGGEGAGKSTQARLLAIWLREQGFDVEMTHEPGATKIGMRLRALLLDTAHAGLSPWAEALMYAADRAEHVSAVIAPALARGAVVVTDRFADSLLAYQGDGRQLDAADVRRVNQLATGGLVPDLTILLDLPPAEGLRRRARSADRLEAEPDQFHVRVRSGFRALAAAEPGRYLVLDARLDPTQLSHQIQARVRDLLPDPVPEQAEEITGTLPAVRE